MLASIENIKKDIEELSKFNATPSSGVTRFSYTEEHRKAKKYIVEEMNKAGLDVYEDAVGNIIGQRSGTNNNLPVVMVGSHFDSVKNGGKFDGTAGVATGLEIARVFKENNIKTKHPVAFIAIVEEEGGRFSCGLLGSKAMIGKVAREDLEKFKDEKGISLALAMKEFGLNPEEYYQAKNWDKKIEAFIELHIEQGPVLEAEQKDVGIVDTIVGIAVYEVEIIGSADHAGTTPMTMRADALLLASSIVQNINKLALEAGEGTVATVGKLQVSPGAVNIVPGKVDFTFEVRSKSNATVENITGNIKQIIQNKCKLQGFQYKLNKIMSIKPTRLSENVISVLRRKASKLNLNYKIMMSGAGHDAMFLNEITNVGMVFVPSKNGRSHCPEEWTDYEKIKLGTDLVLEAVLEIAEA